MTYAKLIFVSGTILSLTACGGGGGGDPKPDVPDRPDRPDNVAPKITSAASVNVAENSTAVLNLTAVDPEGDTISFSITGGDDQSLFSLSDNALSFASAPDFEAPGDSNTDNDYQLEVTATAGDQSTSQAITVSVTDVDEAPSITSAASVNVVENRRAVLDLTAVDPEGDAISFSITGGGDDDAIFSLSGNALSFIFDPDFEDPSDLDLNNNYQLQVSATANGQTTTQDITVTVTDAYEGQIQPPLNDTGITLCGDASSNSIDCIEGGATTPDMPAKQDAHFGRDRQDELDKTGAGDAGFDFTKLGSDGSVLADQSVTDHHCVEDNHTGLIWEVKQNDDDRHDKRDLYTWYDPNPAHNGGDDGEPGASMDDDCYNGGSCNTYDYVVQVNSAGLCGADDWRLPTREELRSIAHYGRVDPGVDTDYFPNTQRSSYWSSSPYANDTERAWYVNFYNGNDFNERKDNKHYVRLVRVVVDP